MRNRIVTTPIPTQKSVRRDIWKGLTSCRAGEMVPIAFFPLLREDRVRGRVTVQVRMDEALETIINPIRVKAEAYLVPKLVNERFNGSMETLNRSYANEPMPDATNPPPWFVGKAVALDETIPIYDKLGVHYFDGAVMQNDLIEAYNRIVGWMRKEISPSLPQPAMSNTALLPAFWEDPKWQHVKPSFDAALLEGAVPVDIDAGRIPVSGIVRNGAGAFSSGPATIEGNSEGAVSIFKDGTHGLVFEKTIYADMALSSGTISLANIALAKQTQAFAKMRERFDGLEDEYLVDLLMQGISVPPEEWRMPILLGSGQAYINQTERYATDAENLDVSVTNGIARLSLSVNTPTVNVGGVVMILLSIVPEQLYERTEDKWLASLDVDVLPNYLRDYLDPQKVEIMTNSAVDVLHSDPDGIFGYEPLNHRWNREAARVGGKFLRPEPQAFVEDRARIWAVEKDDPVLGDDFYMCPQPFPHYPFADTQADPFEVITIGAMEIVGLTVMGGGFEEDSNAYEKVLEVVPADRLRGDGTESPPTRASEPGADSVPDSESDEAENDNAS